MSSAPRPQISPSTRSPDHGSRAHSSGSARTVSVCASSASDGPVAARQARDEVRAVGRAADELARDAAALRGSRASSSAARVSFPGGLTVLSAEELLQERGHLLAEGHASAWDRAVSSLRTSQSSGNSTLWIEPAEHLDRRALRPDDAVADHARDDAVVADAPRLHPLVELDQRLGELVQLLVLAPVDVERRASERPACSRARVERLAEPRQRRRAAP